MPLSFGPRCAGMAGLPNRHSGPVRLRGLIMTSPSKLARNFLAGTILAAILTWWI